MSPVHYEFGHFPPQNLDFAALAPSISAASVALGHYRGLLEMLPNPWLLLIPLSRREAVLSSRIEGTRSNLDDVLLSDAGAAPQSAPADDAAEVLNHLHATRKAIAMMAGGAPLCERVLRASHKMLITDPVYMPGEYRNMEAWIGKPGGSKEQASFLPPPPELVPGAMQNWEHYLSDTAPEPLVQAALLHAEFERVHPFADGNGRIGRMLVPLFLWQREVIAEPVFPISGYFERNRRDYYGALRAVSRDNDWTGWCQLFLQAVREQAEESIRQVTAIFKLYDDLKHRPELTRSSSYFMSVLDCAFERPILGLSHMEEKGVPYATARRISALLVKHGVLEKIIPGSGRRRTLFSFPALLEIVKV